MSGVDGNDGPKGFYIHVEALPGKGGRGPPDASRHPGVEEEPALAPGTACAIQ